ncbi:hypothetical protein SPACI_005120 [Sporomusa acidovorans DSM 3132]|uniref:Uncharacterized protein n=1 Tax=Sporomusa acidovorans (strain ATCC 49682 / DSM 3132 / Mol) TaxID=1123286 RepID=A0ABZ3IXB8_SPOA4|nr:hypothetical protein SPACI_00950 [Sporomusa acidovorans DSM 3132]SDE44742.1 hypothetical protein SAMN04488499_1013127 [Sporomusa acidovorans]
MTELRIRIRIATKTKPKALVLGNWFQADEVEVHRAVSGCLSAVAVVSLPTNPQGDLRHKTAACNKIHIAYRR